MAGPERTDRARPVIALLLRLYPAGWRTRYGDEFGALLAERPLGPFDVADVLLGALDAHLHLRGLGSWSEHRRGFPMSLRIGGIAAAVGGLLVFTGLIWSAVDPADSDPGPWVFLLGTIALLVGLAGLSAFQARRHPALVWAAFLLPAAGGAVLTFGLLAMAALPDQRIVGDWSAWDFFIVGLLATVAGSLLFAITTYVTDVLPQSGSVLLGAGAAITLGSFVISMVGVPGIDIPGLEPLVAFAYLAFPLGWIAMGVQAIRSDRPSMAASGA